MPDAAAEAVLEQSEFHPRGNASGNGESGDAPALVDAEEAGEGEGREIAERRGENDAKNRKTQRGARVAKSVIA